MIVFVAGATGAIGRRLVPLLRQDGHRVVGTTRSETKAEALRLLGATPVIVDVFDAAGVAQAVCGCTPDVIVHQLTDLPQVQDPAQADLTAARNAKVRREGTRNLMTAAAAARVKRVVAQSIAWMYAAGPGPRVETDLLDTAAEGSRAVSLDGVVSLETAVLNAPGIEGIVLRYGRLYGPGTWSATRSGPAPLHVEAAAQAARLALTRGEPGIYNVAEDDGTVRIDKARRSFGFDPDFRMETP